MSKLLKTRSLNKKARTDKEKKELDQASTTLRSLCFALTFIFVFSSVLVLIVTPHFPSDLFGLSLYFLTCALFAKRYYNSVKFLASHLFSSLAFVLILHQKIQEPSDLELQQYVGQYFILLLSQTATFFIHGWSRNFIAHITFPLFLLILTLPVDYFFGVSFLQKLPNELAEQTLQITIYFVIFMAFFIFTFSRKSWINAGLKETQNLILELTKQQKELEWLNKDLHQSEERFKNIVESSNTYFWEIDADLKVTYVSGNFEIITGFKSEFYLGKSILTWRNEDEINRTAPLFNKIQKSRTPFKGLESTIQHADGHDIQLESSGIPIILDDQLIGWRGSNRNITKEVEYKKTIESSEARLRHIIETSNNYFWEVNLKLEFTYLSANFESITGYTQDEGLGKAVFFLYTDEEQKNIRERLPNILQDPENIEDLERILIRNDGRHITTLTSSVPVYQDGKLIAFRGHERDVTIEHELRKKLNDSLNHTQTIVSSLPDMIFVINDKGIIEDCKNPDPIEIGDVNAFIGKNLRDIYSPRRANYFLEIIKETLKGPEVNIIEYRIKNSQGEKNYYETRAIRIKGQNTRVLAVTRNVTKAKEAAQKLVLTLEKLKRSNEDLEQFAFVASHDLQQPIRLVSSYTKLLKQSKTAQFDEKDNQYIGFIEESCNRMKILVVDLLEFSKLEAKKMRVDRIDIKSLFNPLLLTFHKQIREKNAEVKIGRMPQIMCDPVLISQVFANLISNALKFHEPTKPPKISITANLVENKVEFTVEDQGLGIPEEDRERIFNIFQRSSRTSHIKGTGIGMALCQKIVTRHGGEIWIADNNKPGTTIHFTIPELVVLN